MADLTTSDVIPLLITGAPSAENGDVNGTGGPVYYRLLIGGNAFSADYMP